MSAAATNLADTASLLTEVTNVFNPEEDVAVLNKFVETSAETTRGAEEKQAEIKQIVRGAWPTSSPRHAPRRAAAAAAGRARGREGAGRGALVSSADKPARAQSTR